MKCTIKGFEKLTKQQMFDMTAAHILSTGIKSENANGCQYAGSGCAASVFIKPELREACDAVGYWGDLVSLNRAKMMMTAPAHEKNFVSQLQTAHDTASPENFLADWKAKMLTLACTHELDASIFGNQNV